MKGDMDMVSKPGNKKYQSLSIEYKVIWQVTRLAYQNKDF